MRQNKTGIFISFLLGAVLSAGASRPRSLACLRAPGLGRPIFRAQLSILEGGQVTPSDFKDVFCGPKDSDLV